MPLIPATPEAETGESLEPGRFQFQFQRVEIMPLHSGLSDRVRLHLEKEKKKRGGVTSETLGCRRHEG